MAIKANTKPSNKPPATPVPAPAPPPDTSAQEAEKKNIETKQGELRGKISENDVKISRLNDTERKLRPYVLEVETLYNNFLGEYDKDAVWVGERYTKYHDYAEFTFFASYRDYNNKSYDFLDDIKQKVKDLKTENDDFQSQINTLSTKWDNLTAEINSLLNR